MRQNTAQSYVYFLMSMNYVLKLLESCIYFLTSMNFMLKLLNFYQSQSRKVSCEIAIFYGALSHEAMLLIWQILTFAPHPFFMQVRKQLILRV